MNENELREIDIEKLACAVCKAVYNNGECGSCQHLLESKVIARKLFDNGVRKIQDGAVVLTKEEYYEWLDESCGNAINRLAEIGDAIDKACKETAGVILNKLLNMCYDENHPRNSVSAGEIRYIAKIECGVEVDE